MSRFDAMLRAELECRENAHDERKLVEFLKKSGRHHEEEIWRAVAKTWDMAADLIARHAEELRRSEDAE